MGDIIVVVPERKKFAGFEHYENRVVVNFEDDFKDGDYITVAGMTFISKGGSDTEYYVLSNHNYDELSFDSSCGYARSTYTHRLATKQEIDRLNDKLRKVGKKWNPKTKTIDNLPRWRADIGGVYYFVGSFGLVEEYSEIHNYYSDLRYKIGNYFKTAETAEKAASEISKVLNKYKEY